MLRFRLRHPNPTMHAQTARPAVGRRWARLSGLFLLLLLGFFSFYTAFSWGLPTSLYAQTQGRLAVVGAQGTDLYDAPDGTVLATLTPGATLTAVGRTADSRWVVVETDAGESGWVETRTIVIFGTEQLPVMADMAAESPTAVPSAVVSATAASATGTTTATTAPVTAGATAVATVAATMVPPTATPTAVPPTATPTPLPPTPTPAPPTPTPLPPTPTPVPPTPTLAMGAQAELIAVVSSKGATLRSAPTGDALLTLATGTALSARGRTADERTLFVTTMAGENGWVAVTEVVVFNVKNLPVMDETSVSPSPPVATTGTVTGTVTTTEEVTTAVTSGTPAAAPASATAVVVSVPQATATQAMRPTPVADGKPTVQVAMTGSRLNVRSGPGTTFPIIAKALPREVFIAVGRTTDNTWVQLEVPDVSGGLGWVSATYVVVSEPIATLPISQAVNETAAPASASIPLPAAQPTAAPTTASPAATTEFISPAPTTVATATAAPSVQRTGPTGLSGNLVIQSSWGGTFYLYNLSTGELRPLTSGLDPAISPDGTQVAFSRIGNANGIYLINIDGSNERKIFGERDGLMSPKWSPDGKWIVFSRNDGFYRCRDFGFGLCLTNAQIIAQFNLPNVPGLNVDKLFSDYDRIERPEWMIARIAANGDDYRDLAALNSARAPDWNEAGIVYQSTAGIQLTKDEADANTTQVYYDGYDWDPDWQPNGGRIVFQSKEGPHWEIFAVNPDGTGLVALTRPVTTLVEQLPSNVSPTWSPDGNLIAYLSNRDENNNAGAWRVWVMNADGSNQRPLPVDLEIGYTYNSEQMISWGR
ncbi:MAG: PD40 domain-containing protein [Caldilineaceae bacterium]|nr:PD40 domain-containing protein [Caldilineaceae bacterium]